MRRLGVMLIAGGIYHFVFGVFHSMFWRFKFLNWREELPHMLASNLAVIQMLNIAVIVFMLLVAYISLRYSKELPTTSLGRDLLLGVLVFWVARLGGEFILKEGMPPKPGIVIACVVGILLYLVPLMIYMNGNE